VIVFRNFFGNFSLRFSYKVLKISIIVTFSLDICKFMDFTKIFLISFENRAPDAIPVNYYALTEGKDALVPTRENHPLALSFLHPPPDHQGKRYQSLATFIYFISFQSHI